MLLEAGFPRLPRLQLFLYDDVLSASKDWMSSSLALFYCAVLRFLVVEELVARVAGCMSRRRLPGDFDDLGVLRVFAIVE